MKLTLDPAVFCRSCNFIGGLGKGGNLPPIQFDIKKQIRLKQDNPVCTAALNSSVLSVVSGNIYPSCSPPPPVPYHQNLGKVQNMVNKTIWSEP